MDRRSFFKTTTIAGATLFLPDWLKQARKLAEDGKLLQRGGPHMRSVLYASEGRGECGEFILCLDGERGTSPPEMSLAEFLECYQELTVDQLANAELLMDEYGVDIESLSANIPFSSEFYDRYIEDWCLSDCPEARAHDYLSGVLQRLRDGNGHDEIGGISLVHSPSVGSIYCAAEADDVLTLSCLQRALLGIGESTEIRIIN